MAIILGEIVKGSLNLRNNFRSFSSIWGLDYHPKKTTPVLPQFGFNSQGENNCDTILELHLDDIIGLFGET
ncbi:MAG: hypothetical protein WCE96_00450, partial [Nitrososphaeraceae archaeon]